MAAVWLLVKTLYRSFSLTWSVAKQISWNKGKFLNEKSVQSPQELFWYTDMATTTSCENDLLAIYNRKRLEFTKMSAFCSPVFHNATKNVAWLEDDKNKGELHYITALSLLETVWALSIQVWLPLPCLTFSSIFRSIEPLLLSFSSPSMLVRFRDSKLKFTEGGIREWYLYHVKSSCVLCFHKLGHELWLELSDTLAVVISRKC